MARCSGFKPDNSPCERIVGVSQEYCYAHDPARADERRKNASKAAKSKPNREIVSIKQRLFDLADDVLKGKVDRGVAAVASQVLNVYLRAASVEMKVKEVLELEERLSEIEATFERRKGNSRWGA